MLVLPRQLQPIYPGKEIQRLLELVGQHLDMTQMGDIEGRVGR